VAVTLPAMAWMPLVARGLSHLVHARDFTDEEFTAADGAGTVWRERRSRGLDALATRLQERYEQSTAFGRRLRDSFSDLRFTDLSRVPFPFARVMRERFSVFSVVTATRGPWLQNLDGHWTLDVSGAYGLNVAGFDRFKTWMACGAERVRGLGPVLGPLHPVVAENVDLLKQCSGLDEVSFHMSGTEAVMAAVRMARFNTRRRLIVCFAGAYHGWWDGVQPGLGNERELGDCLTLKELHPASLRAIRRRRSEIAAVLVNPIQSFHPNTPPPNDAVLLTSRVRRTADPSDDYRRWLCALRDLCSGCDIPLILDEVYTGFRLAPGGAQQYFGVQADMVVYGKSVAGGMPIGVVCGRSRLMRRVDPEHPMRMAYVVGTFSAHPIVMGAMREFLEWATAPEAAAQYDTTLARCAAWVRATNRRLAEEALPIRIGHFATIWTVLFTESSRYNWLLQYYLRAEGVTLSWVGTGRCLISMDFTDADYGALEMRIVAAARAMKDDGWWLTADDLPHKDTLMNRRLMRETLGSLVPRPIYTFCQAVMKRKEDDHHASHNDPGNRYLHLVSSSVFLYCYAILPVDLTLAMFLGLASLFVRQFGHAVLEPACHDEEKLLLGYNTRNKTLILATYALIPVAVLAQAGAWSLAGVFSQADVIALRWFQWTLAIVFGRVAFLTWKYNVRTSLVWFVKLVTDPMTDLIAYFPLRPQRA
jgi:glutamate-1-semialdehyde 2,1-aminomutase